jgi:hypothetical protein
VRWPEPCILFEEFVFLSYSGWKASKNLKRMKDRGKGLEEGNVKIGLHF